MPRPHRIVLDCDPGHDDAIAILLAHGSPEIDLCAITTVAGNQTLDKTTLNARRMATVAAIRGVPIAAGCDRPLLRELVTAPQIHGASGLDGPSFPEPTVPLAGVHAADLIVDLVMASPGEITLVPTGPLTNVALALRREPRLAESVKAVVLMGGSYTRGNVTPAAEFNVMVDPEAASIVFEAGWPLTMVGLDLTHQAQATPDVTSRIAAVGTPLTEVVLQMLFFLTPITYPPSLLEDNGMAQVTRFNPVARLVNLVRLPILYGQSPTLFQFSLAAGLVAVVVLLAVVVLWRGERRLVFAL